MTVIYPRVRCAEQAAAFLIGNGWGPGDEDDS